MAVSFALLPTLAFILLDIVHGVAGDYCRSGYSYTTRYQYCRQGCCGSYRSQYCCSSGNNYAGYVVGGIIIAVLAIVGFILLVCFCLKKKSKPGRVMGPAAHYQSNSGNIAIIHAGGHGVLPPPHVAWPGPGAGPGAQFQKPPPYTPQGQPYPGYPPPQGQPFHGYAPPQGQPPQGHAGAPPPGYSFGPGPAPSAFSYSDPAYPPAAGPSSGGDPSQPPAAAAAPEVPPPTPNPFSAFATNGGQPTASGGAAAAQPSAPANTSQP